MKRCRAFGAIESLEIKDLETLTRKAAKGKSHPLCGPGDLLIVLDERGEQWASKGLAEKIQKWTDDPAVKTVYFLIGGPYGLDEETRKAASHLWCLSKLTFQGDLAWLMTWEQIYRAFTIIKGMPYHHE